MNQTHCQKNSRNGTDIIGRSRSASNHTQQTINRFVFPYSKHHSTSSSKTFRKTRISVSETLNPNYASNSSNNITHVTPSYHITTTWSTIYIQVLQRLRTCKFVKVPYFPSLPSS